MKGGSVSPPVSVPVAPLRYLRDGLAGPQGALALRWYDDAREGCTVFAAEHDLPLETVAGVLACTSPRVHVAKNAGLARSVLLHGLDATSGLLPSVRSLVGHFLGTGRIGNRPDKACKVRAFYRAILGDPDAVVIDVWVARALGAGPGELSGTKYRRAADTVRSLSGRARVAPRTGQAAIWYGVRSAAGHTGGVSRLRIDRPTLVQGDLFRVGGRF